MDFIDCQKHAYFFNMSIKLLITFLCLDVKCKDDDIIHYAINVLMNVRW